MIPDNSVLKQRYHQVWDASTGDTLFTYQSHCAIRAVTWSGDGVYLACTSYDKTVDVWQIS